MIDVLMLKAIWKAMEEMYTGTGFGSQEAALRRKCWLEYVTSGFEEGT